MGGFHRYNDVTKSFPTTQRLSKSGQSITGGWEEVMRSYQDTRRHRERGGPLVGQRFKSVAVRWWLVPVLRAVESIHRRRF